MKPAILIDQNASKGKRDKTLPLASIVIVNLNQGHYLLDCLTSVINQTYQNLEIILQDGESSDNSLQILKEFPQVNVVSEADFSSGHAFAKGTQRANGEYIFFLNSSDGFYSRDWIAKAIYAIEQSIEISMVTGTVVGVDADSNLNSYTWPRVNSSQKLATTNFYSWLFDGFGFTPITFGIRASVFKTCSAPPERFQDPKDPYSVDFFWYFSEVFFSKGYVSIGLNEIAAFVRFHTDRVDDSVYLTRQMLQLNRFIKRFRRELLFGKKPYIFVDSQGKEIENNKIGLFNLWKLFLTSKVRHLILEKLNKRVGSFMKLSVIQNPALQSTLDIWL